MEKAPSKGVRTGCSAGKTEVSLSPSGLSLEILDEGSKLDSDWGDAEGWAEGDLFPRIPTMPLNYSHPRPGLETRQMFSKP